MQNLDQLTIKVRKEDLLGRLKTNRGQHVELFQKAMKGYVNLTIKELEQKLTDVRAGKEIDRWLVNIAPASHEDDYDDAIDMLEMCTDLEIVLTRTQFRQYVKDDWGWKQEWLTTSNTYAANA